LRQQGILTEEEFQVQRARLLGQSAPPTAVEFPPKVVSQDPSPTPAESATGVVRADTARQTVPPPGPPGAEPPNVGFDRTCPVGHEVSENAKF
jgi:hypothetical protein